MDIFSHDLLHVLLRTHYWWVSYNSVNMPRIQILTEWKGKLYDNYGPRWLLVVGTFLEVFGMMMLSLSTEYYQILLSQGVCTAIGASTIFYPAMSSITTWFFKKRGAAFGIIAAGSSLGGVILPIMASI
jgi:MFS family permease